MLESGRTDVYVDHAFDGDEVEESAGKSEKDDGRVESAGESEKDDGSEDSAGGSENVDGSEESVDEDSDVSEDYQLVTCRQVSKDSNVG